MVNVDLSIVSHSHVTMDVIGQEWEDTSHHTATIKHLDLPAKMVFDRFFETHYSLVVWNMKLIFPEYYSNGNVMECHHPNWRSHIFQRGGYTTNQVIVGFGESTAGGGRHLPLVVHEVGKLEQNEWLLINQFLYIFISDIAGPQTRIEKYKNSGKMW